MISYKTIPFQAVHAQTIRVQDAQKGVINELVKEEDSIWEKMEELGRAWTLVCDERIVGMAGIIPQWPSGGDLET